MQKVGSFRLELDHDGIAQLLKSSEVAAECEAAAGRIAAAAGDGFEVSGPWRAGFGGGRAAYSVRTATQAAREAEATEKALTVAVQSCRS